MSAAGQDGALHSRRTGWLHANMFVLCIAVLSIVYLKALQLGANVVAFIALSTLFAGVATVAVTRPRGVFRQIAQSPLTWVVGASHVMMEGAYFISLGWLSPADSALLLRLSPVVAMAAGLALFGRAPARRAWLGAGVIVAGVGLLLWWLDWRTQAPGIIAALAACLIVTVRTFSSEFHPQNRAARTVAEKMAVTGVLVLVFGATLTTLLLALGALMSAGVVARIDMLPTLADFVHPPTVLLALLVGAALFTAMNYFQFSAAVAIGTESFLAATVSIPVAVTLMQVIAGAAGFVDVPPVGWQLVPVITLIAIGTAIIITSRR